MSGPTHHHHHFFTPFIIRNKMKAQTQLDANLDKMKKWLIECLVVVV